MEKKERNKLRKTVIQARGIIEEDAQRQLRRLGIQPNGNHTPTHKLPHLTDDEKETRQQIILSIEKEKAGDLKPKEAYERYVRHTGFTFINRIAAIRALEARGLIKQTIERKDEYAGASRREFEIADKGGPRDPDTLLKTSLLEAFEEMGTEIRMLFDLDDEYSLIFPEARATRTIIQILGTDLPQEVWFADDVIGWIYQYYNSEARAKFRKQGRKPKPDEIPVINQFYTPQWIVKALVDNTLGRIWVESGARREEEATTPLIKPEKSVKGSVQDSVSEFCSYLTPPQDSGYKRLRKPAREIKVLDPACGSGHFLIYAFDILYRMYLEDEPQTPRDEIPSLIIEHNLYGIDIDLRAVQLAALSLYMKAKTYHQETKITKMNLVCADARITDGEVQRRFLDALSPDKELQRLFARILRDLAYTYDLGSLLKIRKPFEDLLKTRYKDGQRVLSTDLVGQTQITPKGLGGQSKITPNQDGSEASMGSATVSISQLVDQVIQHLIEFEKEASENRDMGTMLFATEAEKSTSLLALLAQNYDVIVMNPPYGDAPQSAKKYLKEHYPRTHHDYYAAFIEQTIELLEPNGLLGMITGRTFMFLKWYEKIRTEILYQEARPELVLDLNSTPADSILDEATGRWAAAVARKTPAQPNSKCSFIRLTTHQGESNKIETLKEAIEALRTSKEHTDVFIVELDTLKKLPRMPYSYWVPQSIVELFQKYPPLDRDNAGRPDQPKIADLKQGLATADDRRFVRYWWEVDPNKIATNREETYQGKRWVPFVKGGDAYYSDIDLVVNWENDGEEIKKFDKSVVRNEDYYFTEGLCWSNIVSDILMDFRPLARDCIPSSDALSLYLCEQVDMESLIAYLNSSLLAACFNALDPTMHHRHVGYVSQLPVSMWAGRDPRLKSLYGKLRDLKKEWHAGNEKSLGFKQPWLVSCLTTSGDTVPDSSSSLSLAQFAESCQASEIEMRRELHDLQVQIDKIVYDAFGIDDQDRERIEVELRTLRGFPKALKKTWEEALKPHITAPEHVERFLSYYTRVILEEDEDGITTLDSLARRLERAVGEDFGDGAERITEISQLLGMSLDEWLSERFFDFHISLYKRRPVIWQITSSNFSKSRTTKGFDCFAYYHKLSRDSLAKIRSKYLAVEIRSAERTVERLRNDTEDAKRGRNGNRKKTVGLSLENALDLFHELKDLDARLEELRNPRQQTELGSGASWVEEKIAEVRDNGYNPNKDYGVLVNITPLKEAGVLHKAVGRVK